jgi:hypothetical protein
VPAYTLRIEVKGEEQAFALAQRLLRKGRGDLADDLHRAMREAMAGVESEIRRSAYRLPNRNGLADEIATSRIDVTSHASGSDVGIVVSASHRYHLPGLDAGRNVHPLFGNRRHWYDQAVRPGWFSDPVEGRTDQVGTAIRRVVKRFMDSLS